MRLLFLSAVVSAGILHAETVEWIGEGKVTAAGGVFGGAGIAVDDEVSVIFSYNDDAGFISTAFTPAPFTTEERDYYDEINLTIKVKIGARTWEGFVESGVAGIPQTIFVRTSVFAERFDPQLREGEAAEFSSFPLSDGGGMDIMGLKFRGSAAVFLGEGIGVDSINFDEINNAVGSIMTGADELTFSLGLDSIEVQIRGEEPVDIELVLSVAAVDDAVELGWQSSLGLTYELQSNSTLEDADWKTIETVDGTGDLLTRSFTRSAGTIFYRLVIPAS